MQAWMLTVGLQIASIKNFLIPRVRAQMIIRNRLDSIQNQTAEFLPDGTFKSGEGNYILTKDSIQLKLNGKVMTFKYVLNQSKLVMKAMSGKALYSAVPTLFGMSISKNTAIISLLLSIGVEVLTESEIPQS